MMNNSTAYDFSMLPNNKVWFTSDPHFGHKNVIKYCERPFDSIEEMDEILIDRWNMVIDHDDLIICCGDFSLTNPKSTNEILNKLNGNKVLIKGNHEKSILSNKLNRDMFNGGIYDLLNITVIDDEVEYGFQDIILCHYPMLSWNKSHRGSWQLFGHVHGMLDNDIKLSPNQIDVGVDSNDFRPISYQEVKEKITIKNLNRIKYGK
jgi:calcineurin-like phosphoesterase family protein